MYKRFKINHKVLGEVEVLINPDGTETQFGTAYYSIKTVSELLDVSNSFVRNGTKKLALIKREDLCGIQSGGRDMYFLTETAIMEVLNLATGNNNRNNVVNRLKLAFSQIKASDPLWHPLYEITSSQKKAKIDPPNPHKKKPVSRMTGIKEKVESFADETVKPACVDTVAGPVNSISEPDRETRIKRATAIVSEAQQKLIIAQNALIRELQSGY